MVGRGAVRVVGTSASSLHPEFNTRPVGTEFSARQNNLPHCLDLVAEQTCRPPIHDTEQDRTERNGTVALPGLEGRPWADGQIVSSSDLGAEQRVRSVQGTDTAARRQPSRRFASHLQLPRCRGRASATDPVQPGKDRLQAPPSRHNGLRRRQPGRRGRTRATPPPNARGAGRPADLLRCGRADVPCDGHFVWRDREAMP